MRTMTVGLALSGGGALGVAHIGLLEEIERRRIPVHVLCGTSTAAMIGLLFAYGGAQAINEFLDKIHALEFPKKIAGFLMHSTVRFFDEMSETLRRLVPVRSFSDLPIMFSCMATDLVHGSAVRLASGDPITAVMASLAYPGLFPVQRIDGCLLVDGGSTCLFPSEIVRNHPEVDFVIGSSLPALSTAPHEIRRSMSRLAVAYRALEILQRSTIEKAIAYCDFCFTPPVTDYKMYDFGYLNEIRAFGRAYAKQEIVKLLRVLDQAQYNFHR